MAAKATPKGDTFMNRHTFTRLLALLGILLIGLTPVLAAAESAASDLVIVNAEADQEPEAVEQLGAADAQAEAPAEAEPTEPSAEAPEATATPEPTTTPEPEATAEIPEDAITRSFNETPPTSPPPPGRTSTWFAPPASRASWPRSAGT